MSGKNTNDALSQIYLCLLCAVCFWGKKLIKLKIPLSGKRVYNTSKKDSYMIFWKFNIGQYM